MHPLDDTIAAIASAPGGAARGIVRLSGPAVERCLEACFRILEKGNSTGTTAGSSDSADSTNIAGQAGSGTHILENPFLFPGAPRILEGELRLPDINSPLPCEVYLWLAGRSYTGQRVAEFHTFGSPPLLESLLGACVRRERGRPSRASSP